MNIYNFDLLRISLRNAQRKYVTEVQRLVTNVVRLDLAKPTGERYAFDGAKFEIKGVKGIKYAYLKRTGYEGSEIEYNFAFLTDGG